MLARLLTFLVVVLFGALVGGAARSTSKTYHLQDWYEGEDFFTDWTFFSGPDPSNGYVKYLGLEDAQAQGIAYVDRGMTILAVDSTSDIPVAGYRPSVRITSNKNYTGGLFILDAAWMPVGCAVWASFWTKGQTWPSSGEIDIIEGVNNNTRNQMTLHSGESSCTLNTTTGSFTGEVLSTNCHSVGGDDVGCGIIDYDSHTFGHGFNIVHGGVFAVLWDPRVGISMWHFPRAKIPRDITNKRPTPDEWGTPVGFWNFESCDVGTTFQNHQLVINTNICGDWAGVPAVYRASGCPGTCAEMVANATNFKYAKWAISYVAVYN